MSVIVAISTGIALVIVFAIIPVADGNSFSPESYYDWSPEDGGIPRLILTEHHPFQMV